jgi:DNA transposition AAA+ family ATPase
MENSVKKEIVIALQQYMQTHKMKPADVAVKSDINPGYLSLILKEDSNFMYKAGDTEGFINSKYFYALADLCGYKLKKEYWQLQPTSQMTAAIAHLQLARENAQVLTLIGETGCGKSYTAELFAAKNPLDTFIVTAGSSDTLNDLINKIIEVLNIQENIVSKSARIRAIAKKMRALTRQDLKPMLIIDESEFLKQPALCAIKGIHDFIKDHSSLVLIGTDQLVNNVERLKKRNHAGVPQFHRRIKMGLRILPTLDKKFSVFLNDIQDNELKKFLLKNCNNYGELHDVLVPSLREADRLQEQLSMNLVRKVLNLPSGDLQW